jgi:hypothetical protein
MGRGAKAMEKSEKADIKKLGKKAYIKEEKGEIAAAKKMKPEKKAKK